MHDPGPSRPPLRSPCAVDEEWIMAWVTNGQWRWWLLADDLNVRLPSSLCGWWMARLSAHTESVGRQRYHLELPTRTCVCESRSNNYMIE